MPRRLAKNIDSVAADTDLTQQVNTAPNFGQGTT